MNRQTTGFDLAETPLSTGSVKKFFFWRRRGSLQSGIYGITSVAKADGRLAREVRFWARKMATFRKTRQMLPRFRSLADPRSTRVSTIGSNLPAPAVSTAAVSEMPMIGAAVAGADQRRRCCGDRKRPTGFKGLSCHASKSAHAEDAARAMTLGSGLRGDCWRAGSSFSLTCLGHRSRPRWHAMRDAVPATASGHPRNR